MKKLLAMVLALSLMLGLIPAMAAAEDDWVTLRVEMYDRSTAGFNVEDCWQLHYIQENFGDPNHINYIENGFGLMSIGSQWEHLC